MVHLSVDPSCFADKIYRTRKVSFWSVYETERAREGADMMPTHSLGHFILGGPSFQQLCTFSDLGYIFT